MESTKIQAQISQTEPKTPEKTDIDFAPVSNSVGEPLINTLESISAKEECFHTPDRLDHLGSDYQGDAIVHAYRCSCGKTVKETFTHSHTIAFD